MRVLIVEDEPRIGTYIKRGLEQQGYAADVAMTGKEALDWVAVAPYDFILLDVMLPEMDGIEVCRELRDQGVKSPILILTARDQIDDRVIGLDAGADDYMVKPFALKELLARLRALSRRAEPQARNNQIEIADLILDTLTQRVRRAGKVVDLTAKEYAVLEYLMREKGRVITRAMIAEHVLNGCIFLEGANRSPE